MVRVKLFHHIHNWNDSVPCFSLLAACFKLCSLSARESIALNNGGVIYVTTMET